LTQKGGRGEEKLASEEHGRGRFYLTDQRSSPWGGSSEGAKRRREDEDKRLGRAGEECVADRL